MRKSFAAVITSLALVACAQEEVVNMPDNSICFANAFIEHTPVLTRAIDPSITTNTITGFNVWAFMDKPANIVLDAEDVTLVDGVWNYSNTQYWTPEHTYYFAALAPMDSQNWGINTAGANEYGAGVVTFTNVDGTEDLLYTATSIKTPDMATLTSAGMPAVGLTFNHLLSKVKFTFINGFETPNYTIEVKDIKMSAPEIGTIDLAVENWWDNDDWKIGTEKNTILAFGDIEELKIGEMAECTNERLTIPAGNTQSYEVTFTVVLYVSGEKAMQVDKTATLTNVAFEMGKGYNVRTEINPENMKLKPIEFDVVEVKKWVEAGNENAEVTE